MATIDFIKPAGWYLLNPNLSPEEIKKFLEEEAKKAEEEQQQEEIPTYLDKDAEGDKYKTEAEKEQERNSEIIQLSAAKDEIMKTFENVETNVLKLFTKGESDEIDKLINDVAQLQDVTNKIKEKDRSDANTVIEGKGNIVSELKSKDEKASDIKDRQDKEDEKKKEEALAIKPIEEAETKPNEQPLNEHDEETPINNIFLNSAFETTDLEEETDEELQVDE